MNVGVSIVWWYTEVEILLYGIRGHLSLLISIPIIEHHRVVVW
jgi:hypothetical protein